MFLLRRTFTALRGSCTMRCPIVATISASTALRSYSTEAAAPGGMELSALDIASQVNKMKRLHQTGQGAEKKRMEMLAWSKLNTLTENQINQADGKAVALLLNSWAYFSKFWERGKEGPITAEDPPHPQAAEDPPQATEKDQPSEQ